jgi:hypothetical protein
MRIWMDVLSRSFYEMKFEIFFMKKKGNEFEDFFSNIMEKRHIDGDFIRVRPWGNVGDRKNDGYLKSERTLYQVYAPNDMTAASAISKIEEDFSGALPYWQSHFDISREGLGPDVTKKLLDLDLLHCEVTILHFGFEELRRKFFELNEQDIIHVVGNIPTAQSFNTIGFESFKVLLGHIVLNRDVVIPDLRPVPKNKLAINKLSAHIEHLIKFGLTKTGLVREFFEKWPDATFGDSITKTINDEYIRLRDLGISPDNIFYKLREFVLGDMAKLAEQDMACLVVLSYFFEECDIFEREVKS